MITVNTGATQGTFVISANRKYAEDMAVAGL